MEARRPSRWGNWAGLVEKIPAAHMELLEGSQGGE